MANSDRLNEVVAMLAERDEEFRPFDDLSILASSGESTEPVWPLSVLKKALGYEAHEPIDRALNKAKVAASKTGWSLKDHFRQGTLFEDEGETYVTKYAAMMIAMNADPNKDGVALAQNYFALQVNRQCLEDEKRLKTRLDVVTENKKLTGVAQDAGVRDFQKFHGIGVSALYGGKSVAQINRMKGLAKGQSYLDYAGSEELAATLFRITQTAAALRRQDFEDERAACGTHKKVATGVRNAIRSAGNTLPENLPAAKVKIDSLAMQKKRELRGIK